MTAPQSHEIEYFPDIACFQSPLASKDFIASNMTFAFRIAKVRHHLFPEGTFASNPQGKPFRDLLSKELQLLLRARLGHLSDFVGY